MEEVGGIALQVGEGMLKPRTNGRFTWKSPSELNRKIVFHFLGSKR